ncbi:MAG: biotin transporter BioY [Spirochaetes bacterium]|nr:biotin transporter BioY [Spirochaetota bacterium]
MRTDIIKTNGFVVSKNILLFIAIPVLTFISAKIRVYLPFSPVPVTFQTFTVLTLAAVSSWYIAVAGQFVYIILGLAGVNIFASQATGQMSLLHPTFGYIIGFLIASFVVSRSLEDRTYSLFKLVMTLILGNLIIYAFGAARLSLLLGLPGALLAGVLPFLYGDALKIILATMLLSSIKRMA